MLQTLPSLLENTKKIRFLKSVLLSHFIEHKPLISEEWKRIGGDFVRMNGPKTGNKCEFHIYKAQNQREENKKII